MAAVIGLLSTSPSWGARCGFYPGSRPGEGTNGTAADFPEARAAFETASSVFLAKRTEADFLEYRRYRASDAWKRTMWDAGCKLPTQTADGRTRCFCGAEIGIADMAEHIYAAAWPVTWFANTARPTNSSRKWRARRTALSAYHLSRPRRFLRAS